MKFFINFAAAMSKKWTTRRKNRPHSRTSSRLTKTIMEKHHEEKVTGGNLGSCCSRKSCSSLSSLDAGNVLNHNADYRNDQPNNNQFHLNNYQLKELKLPKRAPINLEFRDVRYKVKQYAVNNLKLKICEFFIHNDWNSF